jgi:signal transduction histidine kinase
VKYRPSGFDRHTLRLSATYLTIIMVMSIGFSVVFYSTSARQLSRQLPPHENLAQRIYYGFETGSNLDDFLQARVREGKRELLFKLIVMNVVTLAIGAGVSLLLARRTLEPIEATMEAQSRFVSDASHELRTPMTALQTTNEVALRRSKLTDATARDILRENVTEITRLRQLTDGLLGLVKDEPLQPDVVHINDVIEQAVKQSQPMAKAKNIKLRATATDLQAVGSASALTQVLTILLDNAIKYSEPGGKVEIAAERKAKHLQLSVRDHGIGIDPVDQEKVFDRFYRSDTARRRDGGGGFGLGLAIAQKIVTAHEGTIRVDSSVGQGSSFTVDLPATE